jgi:hypothetical protein
MPLSTCRLSAASLVVPFLFPPFRNAGVLQAIIPRATMTGAFGSLFHVTLSKAYTDSELSSGAPGAVQSYVKFPFFTLIGLRFETI